jgi:hypothetical protein
VKRWWLVIALLLSVGMNVGLLVALAIDSPPALRRQQEALRPAAPGRLPQLANRLGLTGMTRDRFIRRQRRFFQETAGPRNRLPEIRRDVRSELLKPQPDPARVDQLLREAGDLYLGLERSLVANVLDSRALLSPDEERRYLDLISRLQLEGPGQYGRLPPTEWPWWRRLRPAAAAPAQPPSP